MSTDLRQLSEREREILQLVAAGLSNQQIANSLGVSVNTIKVHLRNTFGKIGATSRTEATMYAVRAGIVTVERDGIAPGASGDVLPPGEPAAEQGTPVGFDELPETAVPEPAERRPVAEPAQEMVTPAMSNTPVIRDLVPEVRTTSSPSAVPWPRRLSGGVILGLLALIAGLLAVSVWALGRSGAAEATPNTTASVTPNPEISRWRRWGELPAPRAAFAIANLGELIYIVGGENEAGVLDTVARFDSRSGTWAELSKKGTPATDIQAVVIGGRLYVPGGRRSANQADISDAFERYDPRTETWETLPNVPQPRSAYALATVEGNLYLIGGWDGTRFREEVFEYDPDTQKWTERSPMPTARGFASAAVVADSIYVLGGENESGPLAVNEVYTPSQEDAQPWSRRAPMPQRRSRFGAVAAASTIHVIGGEPGGLPLPAYAARTDSWQTITSSPEPVGSQPGVVLLDTTVLSLGGRTGPGEYATSMLGYQALFTSYLPVTTK